MSHDESLLPAAFYRLTPRPTAPLLVPARSSGHYVVDAGWRQQPKVGDFLELFWITSGSCEFIFDGTAQTVRADEVCFYFPGDLHLQRALENHTELYWFSMDGEQLPAIIAAYRLKRTPFPAGECPRRLFEALNAKLVESGILAECQASTLAVEILNQTIMGRHADLHPHATVTEFTRLCEAQFVRPECTVESLAEQLGVHRATLHRLFKQYRGDTPQNYLINCRLQKAIQLLVNTRRSVANIARSCGFVNDNYFIKAFKHRIGKSPGKIRNEHGTTLP